MWPLSATFGKMGDFLFQHLVTLLMRNPLEDLQLQLKAFFYNLSNKPNWQNV